MPRWFAMQNTVQLLGECFFRVPFVCSGPFCHDDPVVSAGLPAAPLAAPLAAPWASHGGERGEDLRVCVGSALTPSVPSECGFLRVLLMGLVERQAKGNRPFARSHMPKQLLSGHTNSGASSHGVSSCHALSHVTHELRLNSH